MKKIFLASTILFLLSATIANAQILNPVKWSYRFKKVGNDKAVVFIKATIEEGWHIYSLHQKDGGPVKTSVTFSPDSKTYKLIGQMSEPKPVTYFEKLFDMDVSYFEHSVIFEQEVKLYTSRPLVKGAIEYMTCNNKSCLPPAKVDFTISDE